MSEPKNLWYFCQWGIYARNYQVSDIPEHITDIVYAFWDIESNGRILTKDTWADFERPVSGVTGNFKAFQELKKKRPINLSLSIGGWTYSKYVSPAIATEENRKRIKG